MNNEELARSLQCSINKQFGEGTYVVGDPISRGSDGYVYKINFINDKTPAALKVLEKCRINLDGSLSHKQIKPDPVLVKKAKNQIRIHEGLKSNYIIRLRNWRQNELNFFMVLEYCQKGDLGNLIQKFPSGMEMSRVRKIGAQLIKGIDTIHRHGVIHMDIKPRNILMGDNFDVKICDFSHSIRIDEISKAKRGGTKAFLAPEVRDLKKKFDQKADIWSYGCTLFQMATGHLPFKNQNINQELSSLNFHKIPVVLTNLLKKIWRFNPQQRLTPNQILNHPFFTGKQLCQKDLIEQPQYLQMRQNKAGLIKQNKKISQSAQTLNKRPISQRWKERDEGHKTLNLKEKLKKSDIKEEGYLKNEKIDRWSKKLWKEESGKEKEKNEQKQNVEIKSNMGKHQLDVQMKKKKTTIDELMNHKLHGNKTDGHRTIGRLSPMNLTSLPFGTITRQDQKIIISEEGLCRYFVTSGKQIQISPCGKKITIVAGHKSKTYALQKLPQKYVEIYERSKEIVKILHKSKTITKSSSRPKTHQNQKGYDSRRKVSEKDKIQANYVSPHFASQVSSMKSSTNSQFSAYSQGICCLQMKSTNLQINLELKIKEQRSNICLSLNADGEKFYLGSTIELKKIDKRIERVQKLREYLYTLVGEGQKYVSNEELSNINYNLQRYMRWAEGVPAWQNSQKEGKLPNY